MYYFVKNSCCTSLFYANIVKHKIILEVSNEERRI